MLGRRNIESWSQGKKAFADEENEGDDTKVGETVQSPWSVTTSLENTELELARAVAGTNDEKKISLAHSVRVGPRLDREIEFWLGGRPWRATSPSLTSEKASLKSPSTGTASLSRSSRSPCYFIE